MHGCRIPHDSPLLVPSGGLPCRAPRFDAITDDDFGPAFDEGMRLQAADIVAIADNPERPGNARRPSSEAVRP